MSRKDIGDRKAYNLGSCSAWLVDIDKVYRIILWMSDRDSVKDYITGGEEAKILTDLNVRMEICMDFDIINN